MKKPIIAIDIDDVVSSQTDVLIKFSNEQYGTQLTREDFQTPGDYWGYYEQIWNIGPDEGKKRFEEFLEARVPLTQVVSQETVAALEELKRKFRLVVVTSRGVDYQEGTLAWLEKHLPDVFEEVHFTELWNKGDEKATKAMICQQVGAQYLIDDNPEHCNLAADAGVKALLFGENGWSTGKELHGGVTRVKDWPEVLGYFDGRS